MLNYRNGYNFDVYIFAYKVSSRYIHFFFILKEGPGNKCVIKILQIPVDNHMVFLNCSPCTKGVSISCVKVLGHILVFTCFKITSFYYQIQ